MPTRLTLTKEMEREINLLADSLGYSREAAMYYAVRLVNACVREGLLTDMPETLWPDEAQDGIRALSGAGSQGKVIEFKRRG